ncbi:MAG: hypothetical protein AAFX87_20725 [Bacteroidota bacterium]
MDTVNVRELKRELKDKSEEELIALCLRLAKFKKENKELLTYLLFESYDESAYVSGIKDEIDEHFDTINTQTYYYIKKSVRKVLRLIRKYARYSDSKETDIELRLYFCQKLHDFRPSIQRNRMLMNIYNREIEGIKKKISALHEDLQFDYQSALDELTF